MRVLVTLTHDRTKLGTAAIFSDTGSLLRSVRCLGKSDNQAAIFHNNPTRDPLKPFGDIPTGNYRGVVSVVHVPDRSYGPHPVIVLNPVSGDCVTAQDNGRWGLLAHGGDPTNEGGLRPTDGCIRFDNSSMAYFNSLGVKEITFEVVETVTVTAPTTPAVTGQQTS